jgi:hypothetical protein
VPQLLPSSHACNASSRQRSLSAHRANAGCAFTPFLRSKQTGSPLSGTTASKQSCFAVPAVLDGSISHFQGAHSSLFPSSSASTDNSHRLPGI